MKERFKHLFLSCCVLYSFYFAYDIPAALNKSINFNGSEFTASKLTMLYSAYAFPNIFLPILFCLYTKFSDRFSTIVFSTLAVVGQIIFISGMIFKEFRTMILGRLIFGIGSESFVVVQNKSLSKSFQGKELSLSLALFVSIGRLGTVSTFIITPIVDKYHGPVVATLLSTILIGIGFILSLNLSKKKEVRFILNENQEEINIEENIIEKTTYIENNLQNTDEIQNENKSSNDYTVNFPLNEVSTSEKTFWGIQNQMQHKTLQYENFIPEENTEQNVWNAIIKEKREEFNETIIEEEALPTKQFHPTFFILLAIAIFFSCVWAPFYNIATLMFQKRYDVSLITAGRLMAIVEGTSMILMIFVGFLADLVGKKLYFIGFGGVILIIAHSMIYFKLASPYISSIFLGIAGPFISAYWPCVVFLTSAEGLGLGFAIFSSGVNLAFTISPILLSLTVSLDTDYAYSEMLLILFSMLAVISVLILAYFNKKLKLGLNEKKLSQKNFLT